MLQLYHLTLQINNIGVISISFPFDDLSPWLLPLSGQTRRFIAPYWADIDTREIGDIYYRQTADPTLLARATSEIRVAFGNSQNVTITNLLIVTWDSVGYYSLYSERVNKVMHKLHCSMFSYCMGKM